MAHTDTRMMSIEEHESVCISHDAKVYANAS